MKILSKFRNKDILTQVKSILRGKKSTVNSTFNGEIYQLSQRLRQEQLLSFLLNTLLREQGSARKLHRTNENQKWKSRETTTVTAKSQVKGKDSESYIATEERKIRKFLRTGKMAQRVRDKFLFHKTGVQILAPMWEVLQPPVSVTNRNLNSHGHNCSQTHNFEINLKNK